MKGRGAKEAEVIAASVAGRIADGVAVWRAVTLGAHDTWLDGQPGGDKAVLKTLVKAFADACSLQVSRPSRARAAQASPARTSPA
jgi:hypothetical protein